MSRGYLIFAQGKYIEMAKLLSKSISKTQSNITNVTIITESYSDNVMLDRTKAYELSPYDETVLLDADMIFLDDVSHWWNHLSKFPLLITSKVKTYRDEWVMYSPYRKTFVSNDLPNCYSAFCYFKKDPQVAEFFKLLESIILNWDEWTMLYALEDRQQWPSIDLAMAIAVKILDLDVTNKLDYPTFTHMKSGCQGWGYYDEIWRKQLGIYISNDRLRLGNYLQSGILHYVDKEVSNELLRLF